MNLYNGTIRPGTVLQVFENGNIKASAPGLLSFVDDPSKMPDIMPWFIGNNSNAFSKLKQYDEVWIMNFEDNPRQLFWFRKDYIEDNLENLPMKEENIEILCNREVGGEWCSIYFSDGSGWVISKGESQVRIRPDGSILLTADLPNRCIDINGSNISIGSEGRSAHPAAYADETEDVLNEICKLLNDVGMTALKNQYTIGVGNVLIGRLPGIVNKISNISSQHVTID
jgi:hypothetical protein